MGKFLEAKSNQCGPARPQTLARLPGVNGHESGQALTLWLNRVSDNIVTGSNDGAVMSVCAREKVNVPPIALSVMDRHFIRLHGCVG